MQFLTKEERNQTRLQRPTKWADMSVHKDAETNLSSICPYPPLASLGSSQSRKPVASVLGKLSSESLPPRMAHLLQDLFVALGS